MNRAAVACPQIVLLLWFAGVLAACGPVNVKPLALEFTTLEALPLTPAWENTSPGILVVATPDEIESVAPYVSAEALAALRQVDYGTHFALLALRGRRSSVVEGYAVERIVWWGNVVTVQTRPGEPTGTGGPSAPHQLVLVKKPPGWKPASIVRLLTPGAQHNIVTVTHPIP